MGNPSHKSAILSTVFIQSTESVESHTWVDVVCATLHTANCFFFTVLIHSTEYAESHTWVAEVLHNPSFNQLFIWSLFKALNLSSLIFGYMCGRDLRNPSHSQLFFTWSSFKALTLSSLISGWVRFAQPFSQLTVLFTVFIQSTESVESHTCGCGLRNLSESLCSIFMHRPEYDGSHT